MPLLVGDQDQARAVAFVAFQAVDVSNQSEWQSSNPAVAMIALGGRVTARAPGVTQLSAKYQGISASAPLTVSQDSDVQALTIEACGGSVLVGLTQDCAAVAHVAGSLIFPNVADKATWSSSHLEIVAVAAGGHVSVVRSGQAQVSATYHGQTATVSYTATEAQRDALTWTGGGETGLFMPGNTVTLGMSLQYSVVSTDAGEIRIRAYDGSNLLGVGPVVTVPKGSNNVYTQVSITIPPTSTKICEAAYLTVGANTLVAPADPTNPADRGALCILVK